MALAAPRLFGSVGSSVFGRVGGRFDWLVVRFGGRSGGRRCSVVTFRKEAGTDKTAQRFPEISRDLFPFPEQCIFIEFLCVLMIFRDFQRFSEISLLFVGKLLVPNVCFILTFNVDLLIINVDLLIITGQLIF